MMADPMTHDLQTSNAVTPHVSYQPCGNSHLTINDLASELLQLIFEAALSGENRRTTTSNGPSIQKSALDTIIQISHVCRRWREVALSTASLWVAIDRFHEDFKMFVARSKSLPIFLTLLEPIEAHLTPLVGAGISFPAWLQHHSGQMREIIVEARATTIDNLFRRIGPSLTSLVSLDLQVCSDEFATLMAFTPKLRRLSLCRIFVNLDAFANLTNLSIKGPYPYIRFPKAADLLRLLRNCPHLHELFLSGLNIDVADGLDGTNDSIELAHLRSLQFQRLTRKAITCLLSRIRIPSCAPLVTRYHKLPVSDGVLHLEIDINKRHVVLGASAQYPSGFCTFRVSLPRPSHTVFSDVEVALSAVDKSSVGYLLYVMPFLPFVDVPTIAVWKAFLACLPSLTSIMILMSKSWIETFVMALCNNELGIVCSRLENFTIIEPSMGSAERADLTKFVWGHLHARAMSGACFLESVRFVGGGHNLDWARVTKQYDGSVGLRSVFIITFHLLSPL